MKKKVLSVAILAISMFSVPTFADDNGSGTPRDCCDPSFSGITLTDAQKAALESLRPSRCGTAADRDKDGRKATARQDVRTRSKAGRDSIGMASRKEYLGKVKEILTHDQYITFLENAYLNTPRAPKGHIGQQMSRRRHHGSDSLRRQHQTNRPADMSREKPSAER